MSETITVKNSSDQVSTFLIDGPDGLARKAILEQRIARGELEKVTKTTKSAPRGRRTRVIIDSDAGLKDERGDLLKSVHGGGHDPDADGDVLGDPSGSKEVEDAVEAVEAISDAAIAQAEAQPQTAPAKKAAVAKKATVAKAADPE